MPDTLTINELINLRQHVDSLIQVHKAVQPITKIDSFSTRYLPFIGVIIGGILTYVGQYFLKLNDNKQNTSKAIRNAIEKINTRVISLKFHLAELAYLQIDSRYQYYLSEREQIESKKNRALDEHYNDYKYIAEHKFKIAEYFGEIVNSVTAFFHCKNQPIPPETLHSLNEVTNSLIDLRISDAYEPSEEIDDARIGNDVDLLTAEYMETIKQLEAISNTLIP